MFHGKLMIAACYHRDTEKSIKEEIEGSRSHRGDTLDRMFDRFLSDYRHSNTDSGREGRDDRQSEGSDEEIHQASSDDEGKENRDTRLKEVHRRECGSKSLNVSQSCCLHNFRVSRTDCSQTNAVSQARYSREK
jgi:hypothetical protein